MWNKKSTSIDTQSDVLETLVSETHIEAEMIVLAVRIVAQL